MSYKTCRNQPNIKKIQKYVTLMININPNSNNAPIWCWLTVFSPTCGKIVPKLKGSSFGEERLHTFNTVKQQTIFLQHLPFMTPMKIVMYYHC